MSKKPRGRRDQVADVFLNIPFDREHEYLYLALIAGLVGFGLNPRCVLEIPPQQDRLRRLMKLIAACPYSLHDLSCVGLSARPFRVPRFNMPFELGLAAAVALQEGRQRHDFRVLDAVPHRFAQSLSDMSGYDSFIHRGTAVGVLEVVRDIFVALPAPPLSSLHDLQWVYRQIRRYRMNNPGNIFRASVFGELLIVARTLVAARRG